MAIRKIIEIDEEKCTGCGLCAEACHEGAIEMIDGVAKLTRDDYCDGFGDCLPACPAGAIHFVEREAAAYDEAAVEQNKLRKAEARAAAPVGEVPNEIGSWPIQIKLLPVQAPYFDGCDLLVAADCTAFAHGNFHAAYMRDKITVIACPKLDGVDYTDKLAAILASNDIRSVQMCRMQVPCCGGLERAVRQAIDACGKDLPLEVVTFTLEGDVLSVTP